jgi:hypothetical protein
MIASPTLRAFFFAVVASLPALGAPVSFNVTNLDSSSAWNKILASVGIPAASSGVDPDVQVIGANATVDIAALSETHLVVVQGSGSLSQALGFKENGETVQIRQICDVHAPKSSIIWEQPVGIAAVTVPPDYQVFAKEKWKGTPVLAGKANRSWSCPLASYRSWI